MACMAMVCFNTGCSDKKPEPADTVIADTLVPDTAAVPDTLVGVVEEVPMPKTADELFDDFFFNFINNKKLQRGRVKFPLPVWKEGQVEYVQRSDWQMEYFFRDQEYYTLIFDDEKQMEVVKDTEIDNVVVEKIRITVGTMEQFQFLREGGKWALTEVRNVDIEESANASFLTFLQRFFTEPEFQTESVSEPLSYHGPDPEGEDDAEYVDVSIPAASWSDYLPEMPDSIIYNILYGQKYAGGDERIFMFKGISNGLETELVFRRSDDGWKLVKINV